MAGLLVGSRMLVSSVVCVDLLHGMWDLVPDLGSSLGPCVEESVATEPEASPPPPKLFVQELELSPSEALMVSPP